MQVNTLCETCAFPLHVHLLGFLPKFSVVRFVEKIVFHDSYRHMKICILRYILGTSFVPQKIDTVATKGLLVIRNFYFRQVVWKCF